VKSAPLTPVTPDRAARMRRTATGLLAAMAVLFLVAHALRGSHPAWPWVLAFAEAAMVGGLADWFAVTALFRRPLGLPIPHTAIIPENKDRIADTMAAFLQDNFLTAEVVARRMQGMNLAAAAGAWLADPQTGQGERLRAGAGELLAQVLESLDPDRLGGQVRAGLVRQLDRLEVAPMLGGALAAAIADKRHMAVIESLVRWAGFTLEANEALVRELIHRRANAVLRWTGLDEKLANSVIDGLYKLLAEVIVEPDHPLRAKIEEGLAQLAWNLAHDAPTQAKVQRIKRELLANPALSQWWQAVWERARTSLIARLRDPHGALGASVRESMAELGLTLQADPALQDQLNRLARRTAVGLATRYGSQIVRLVSETVKRWDATTVTRRLEGAVGRDLQFIRINGTLVGGTFGLAIHAVEVWL